MAQGSEALGRVDWAVVDTESGREIESGVLDLVEENIAVNDHLNSDNLVYYRKSIALTGPFSFSIDEHPGRTSGELKGFLFKGERSDAQAFSSEWFNVTGPNEATKLQEPGKLAIEIGQGAHGWEVVRTEFETDVSLRICRFDGDPYKEPSIRITIRKGSWVAWPTV